jgi:hypothetical protein
MHTATRLVAAVAVAAVVSQPSYAWAQTGPDLTIAISHTGNFTVGVDGVYTIVVSNIGGTATSESFEVLDHFESLPFTFVSAAGVGWFCSYFRGFPNEYLTCENLSSIASAGSAAPITVTVLPSGSGTVTNRVTVEGGRETNFAIHSASDVTIVLAGVPTLPQWALIALTVCLALAGVAALRTRTT